MISLIERPEPWSFSRNFIRYRFTVTATTSEVQVRLYIGDIAGNTANDRLVANYPLYPNPDGTVELYVEADVDAFLDWQLPSPVAGRITPVTTQTNSFFVEYREIATPGSNPAWISDIADRRLAFKGGLPLQLFNRSTPTQFTQFSYQAAHVARVGVDAHFYRTFVSFDYQQVSRREAKISILFSDNTTQQATIVFTSLVHNIYQVPASPAAFGISLAPGKIPVSYEVVVEDTINSIVQSLTLIEAEIDHNWYRATYAFQYHNSLGGLDYMRILGDITINNERSFTDGERIAGGNYNQPIKRGIYQQRNISLEKTYKGDAGYFITPEEQDLAEELDLSESIWMLGKIDPYTNQWQQIRMLSKSRTLRSTSSKRWSWEIEFQFAYNIKAFSAQQFPGLGSDTNVYTPNICGIPTGLTVTYLSAPDVNGIYAGRLSWTGGANGSSYELRVRAGSSMPWITPSVTGTSVDFTPATGIQFYAGTTYEWQVRTICSTTSASGWVNGPNIRQ